MSERQAKSPVFGNSLVLASVLALAMAAAGYSQRFVSGSSAGSADVQSAYRIGAFVGGIAGALLFPLLAGWIAYWIGARSTRAARITACVIAVLSIFGSAATILKGSSNPRTAAQHAASMAELAAARAQQVEALRSGDTSALAAAGERTANAVAKMGEGDSTDLKAATATMATLARELNALSIKQNEAFATMGSLGGIAPESMKSLDDIEARIKQIDVALDDTTRCRDYLAAFEEKIQSGLQGAGVSPETMASVLKGYRKNGKMRAKQLELGASNIESCGTMRAILSILKTHFEHWEVDDEGSLMFADSVPDADIEQYNKAQSALDEQIKTQESLITEIADLLALANRTQGK
jgi:hypothetical protein